MPSISCAKKPVTGGKPVNVDRLLSLRAFRAVVQSPQRLTFNGGIERRGSGLLFLCHIRC